MKKSIFIFAIGIITLMLSGCTKEPDNPNKPGTPDKPVKPVDPVDPVDPKKEEIKINVDLDQMQPSENRFENGDFVGIYVVDYEGANPGTLKDSGNRVDNMKFTYSKGSDSWTPDRKVYWPEDQTKADLYLIYPYTEVNSVSAMQFSVRTDQSTEQAYRSSNLMVGRTLGVSSTGDDVKIVANPVLSHVSISIKAGTGFTNEMIANAKVRLNNLMADGVLDVASGQFTSGGATSSIIPFLKDGIYKAVLVPQSMEGIPFISITICDDEFTYAGDMNFQSGKKYDINISIANGSNGINVNISPWSEEEIYHGVVE